MVQTNQELVWRRSLTCDANACVEVAHLDGGSVLVRNSGDPTGPALHYTKAEWDAFVAGVNLGEFDL